MSIDYPSDISRLEEALESLTDQLRLIVEHLERIGDSLERSAPKEEIEELSKQG